MSTESPLFRLPNDIANTVFNSLEMEDLFALHNTCRIIRTKYLTPDFWKKKLQDLLHPEEEKVIDIIMSRLEHYYQHTIDPSDFQMAVKKMYKLRKGIMSKYAKFHRIFLIIKQYVHPDHPVSIADYWVC